jgi:capsular polysaccharide transport system permease protein
MPELIAIPRHPPWVTQFLVIRALLFREATTRFGKYRLGLFWMLFEPLLGTLVIGLLIGTIAERTVPEIPYPFFLLNGFLLLRLFTGPMGAGMRSAGANSGLLVYPTVKALDPLIARFLFELLTTIGSMILFSSVGMWIGIELSAGALHILLACYLITWLAGCGFGLIFGVAAAYYKEVEKIVQVIQRPLLFVSAVLFPLSAIPQEGQYFLLFNPVVHTIEIARHSLFPYYRVEQVNLVYPTIFALVVLATGLTLFHNHRHYLSSR